MPYASKIHNASSIFLHWVFFFRIFLFIFLGNSSSFQLLLINHIVGCCLLSFFNDAGHSLNYCVFRFSCISRGILGIISIWQYSIFHSTLIFTCSPSTWSIFSIWWLNFNSYLEFLQLQFKYHWSPCYVKGSQVTTIENLFFLPSHLSPNFISLSSLSH